MAQRHVSSPVVQALLGALLTLTVALAGTAAASETHTGPRHGLADARLQGEAQLRWFGLPVYAARLWVQPGFEPARFLQHAFVLELQYHRALRGADIARRSIEEMARAAPMEPAAAQRWEAQLRALLPDVEPGDRIAGLHRPGQPVRILVNGRAAGEIGDAAFAAPFFGIWLAPTSPEPRLRAELLGIAAR